VSSRSFLVRGFETKTSSDRPRSSGTQQSLELNRFGKAGGERRRPALLPTNKVPTIGSMANLRIEDRTMAPSQIQPRLRPIATGSGTTTLKERR
jgi:hypothetical protein